MDPKYKIQYDGPQNGVQITKIHGITRFFIKKALFPFCLERFSEFKAFSSYL